MQETPRLHTLPEVAREFSVHPATIQRWISQGIFPRPVRFGRTLRWRRVDLDEAADYGKGTRTRKAT